MRHMQAESSFQHTNKPKMREGQHLAHVTATQLTGSQSLSKYILTPEAL